VDRARVLAASYGRPNDGDGDAEHRAADASVRAIRPSTDAVIPNEDPVETDAHTPARTARRQRGERRGRFARSNGRRDRATTTR
jgi:hypothetical protein